MDYGKAINEIVNKRRASLDEARLFFRTLLDSNAEFRDAELSFRSAELDFFSGKIEKAEYEKAKALREEIIDKLGVRARLYPAPACSSCNDTGRGADGNICSCAKRLALQSRSALIEFPLRSFDDLDLSLYPESAHALVLKTGAELKMIASKGADSKRKNINLIGSAGTGKTFLASCFAGECSALGKTVVFITAFNFVDRALKYHTTFDQNKAEYLEPLLETDVLVIDDLGTESIFKNVTLEYLYHIINERQLKGLTTVITSNLSVNNIAIRYGERIASRLFDKKLCYTKEFVFDDIRKITV